MPAARAGSHAGAVDRFADFVSGFARIEDDRALDASRRALADTLGCMLGGATSPATVAVREGCGRWAGAAPVVGMSTRLAAPFAALVNGTAAHALDFDDYDVPANSHPSAVVFAALLAWFGEGDPSGLGCTGGNLLDAHIVGVEIMLRLGEAMNMAHYRRGWHTTLTFGSLAAAAACARAARFDHQATAHALSLAASMASGLTNQGGFGAKATHAGMAAMNGVLAARLAGSGLSASPLAIDGPLSLATAMGDHDARKFEAALNRLGAPLAILEHGLIAKPYPACSYTHRIIDAARALRGDASIAAEAIQSIWISVPDYYLDLLVYPRPQTTAQAMFSAEYAVVAALLDGRFDLASLSAEARGRPVVERLLACCRVEARVPPNADLTLDPRDPDHVRVTLRGGAVREAEVAMPLGTPRVPMNEAARLAKFMDCTRATLDCGSAQRLYAAASGLGVADPLAVLGPLYAHPP